jgi:hypothetical protein
MLVTYVHASNPDRILDSHGIDENGGVPRVGEIIEFGDNLHTLYRVERIVRRIRVAAVVFLSTVPE